MASLFVSDLHLDDNAPWAVDAFCALLAGRAREMQAVYILGDLFEAWVGDDASDAVSERVAGSLNTLRSAGVPSYLLHGNRDFLIGADYAARAGLELLPDPVVADLGGVPTLLTHGDILCTGDASYQELRSTVRDPSWQYRFLSLRPATRALLATEARAGSRAHMQRVAPKIMDVDPDAVTRAFRASRTRRMIHGHTHRPATHEHSVDGNTATRIVLDAWYERASCLIVAGERTESIELARA
jgi:UDP-2,3-diacylglucosamine hydrolase